MSQSTDFHDDYYEQSYAEGGRWSASYPNNDEAVRAGVLIRILTGIAREHYERDPNAVQLKILDMGCGRGWLTYILAMYGDAHGVDPAESVIEHAQKLYPAQSFTVGTPQSMVEKGYTEQFDLIICTEVIERLPKHEDQIAFMDALAQLVKPNGQIIMTTPRGELFERWMRLKTKANQPVENWLTKEQLIQITSNSGLKTVYHEPFGWHGFIIRSSLITRILQGLMRIIGYVGLLPQGLMTYQLLQLRK